MTPLSAEARAWLGTLTNRALLTVHHAAVHRHDGPLMAACVAELERRTALEATDTLVARVADAAREGAVTGDALRRAGR